MEIIYSESDILNAVERDIKELFNTKPEKTEVLNDNGTLIVKCKM